MAKIYKTPPLLVFRTEKYILTLFSNVFSEGAISPVTSRPKVNRQELEASIKQQAATDNEKLALLEARDKLLRIGTVVYPLTHTILSFSTYHHCISCKPVSMKN